MSSAGAPSAVTPGIRALQSISPMLKDALIREVEAEFPWNVPRKVWALSSRSGGQGPNFRELGEWG